MGKRFCAEGGLASCADEISCSRYRRQQRLEDIDENVRVYSDGPKIAIGRLQPIACGQ